MRNRFALVALLAACTGQIDGGGGGGGGGSGSNPPPPTDVQVTVRDGSALQAGVRVVFADPSGAVLADTMTDATGSVKLTMDTGDVSVYRVYPATATPPRPTDIYTFVGVKAGDALVVGDAKPTSATPDAIVVDVPATAQGTVSVSTPCGSGQGNAPNVAITVIDCPAMVDFFVTDGNNSAFYAREPYAQNVDLSSQTLVGGLSSSLSATDVPANTTVNAEEDLVVGTFALFSSTQHRIDAQPANVTLPNVQGSIDRLVLATIDTSGMGQQMLATRAPYAASPATVDVAPNVIPYVSNPQWSASGVSWTETGTGTADAVIAMLDVQPQQPSTITEYWRVIIAPHAGMTLAVPALPDAMYNPGAADQVAISQGLIQATGGYDAIRGNALAVDNIVQAVPAGGAATLSYANGNAPGRVP